MGEWQDGLSSVKFDFLNLLATCKMPLLSRNGSNWLILLLPRTILSFTSLISVVWFHRQRIQLKPKRKIFSWAFWIICVTGTILQLKNETLPVMFSHTPFIAIINAIILFILIQLEVISCSLDNTELFWILQTLTLTTVFTSGSWPDNYSNWLSNQHCFICWITTTFNIMPLPGTFVVSYLLDSICNKYFDLTNITVDIP